MMETREGEWAETGQRNLAAIVFTDVVGFARHANVDEQRALSNLQRDLSIINEVCSRTNGTVLKTMGDGILMRFPSANQALACALEVQRVLHEQSKRLEHRDVLAHRIGVHLGDVITTQNDVYGDGVNVAARLQAEAKPGSVYLSRTVYDVVKGKMKFPAICVGPRHLKGISEPVVVWEVPAIQRQELEKRNEALSVFNFPNAPEVNEGSSGTKAMAIIGVSLLLAVITITLIIIGLRHAALNKEFASIPNTNAHRHLVIRSPVQTPVPTSQVPAPADDTDPLSDSEVVTQLKPLFAKYEFDGMSKVIQAKFPSGEKAHALVTEYQGIGSLMSWIDEQLDKTSAEAPITISDSATGQEMQIFRTNTNNDTIVVKSPTASQVVEFNKLSPQEMSSVAEALLAKAAADGSDQTTLQKSMSDFQEQAKLLAS